MEKQMEKKQDTEEKKTFEEPKLIKGDKLDEVTFNTTGTGIIG